MVAYCYTKLMFEQFAWIGTDCQDTACNVGLTLVLIFILALPFVIGGAILLAIVIVVYKYFKATKTQDIQRQWKFRNILVVTAIAFALLVAGLAIFAVTDNRKLENRILDAPFSMYAPPGHTLDTQHLQSTEPSTPYVESRYDTPLGKINVVQGEYTSRTRLYFRPPDKCDIDALYDYLISYDRDNYQLTDIPCRSIELDNGWTVLSTSNPERFGNVAPYAATKGATIILFKAARTTGGEFQGTSAQAEKYVVEFLNTAEVIDPRTLVNQ